MAKQDQPIKEGTLTRIRDGKSSRPALRYNGTEPQADSTLVFEHGGHTCRAKVTDTTEANGEILAEFGEGYKIDKT